MCLEWSVYTHTLSQAHTNTYAITAHSPTSWNTEYLGYSASSDFPVDELHAHAQAHEHTHTHTHNTLETQSNTTTWTAPQRQCEEALSRWWAPPCMCHALSLSHTDKDGETETDTDTDSKHNQSHIHELHLGGSAKYHFPLMSCTLHMQHILSLSHTHTHTRNTINHILLALHPRSCAFELVCKCVAIVIVAYVITHMSTNYTSAAVRGVTFPLMYSTLHVPHCPLPEQLKVFPVFLYVCVCVCVWERESKRCGHEPHSPLPEQLKVRCRSSWNFASVHVCVFVWVRVWDVDANSVVCQSSWKSFLWLCACVYVRTWACEMWVCVRDRVSSR